jgi:hypothetical protein
MRATQVVDLTAGGGPPPLTAAHEPRVSDAGSTGGGAGPSRPGSLSPMRKPAGVAGKIAAFSSGVAPVKSAGVAGEPEEPMHTVLEVLHQLEHACRV